jgi:hypothetical protein
VTEFAGEGFAGLAVGLQTNPVTVTQLSVLVSCFHDQEPLQSASTVTVTACVVTMTACVGAATTKDTAVANATRRGNPLRIRLGVIQGSWKEWTAAPMTGESELIIDDKTETWRQ